MAAMTAFLTIVAFLVLVAVAAYVIHRLGLQHADRIAAYRYSTPRPGRRGRVAPQPHPAPWAGVRTSDRRPGSPAPAPTRPAATRSQDVDTGSGAPEDPSD
ncbi:hypothetical protein AQJ30_16585 [Streptomyces longwoodensis]|uniref:Uncharacterized protein n=2 Tax=Streptomyces longwoodensis TaxID=68231 RepID=A0A124HR37_9ACTN|nr:hypothetical protein AQJ30_16585 [Streptomyces longwoodensis]